LLLLLLGGGVYYMLFAGNRGTEGGGSTASATTTSGPTDVFLDSTRYVGRPVADVAAELEGQGLVVAQRMASVDQLEQSGRAFDAGAVVALNPTDTSVPVQSTVTLYYAEEAYAPGDEEPEPTTAAPTPTEAAPTTATTAPTTTTLPQTSTSTSASLGEGTTTTPPPASEPVDPPPSDGQPDTEGLAAPE
jgi:hypothetical protein